MLLTCVVVPHSILSLFLLLCLGIRNWYFIVYIQEGTTLDVRCKCTPDGYFEYHSFARNSNILWILLSLSFSFPHFTTLVNLIAYIPF